MSGEQETVGAEREAAWIERVTRGDRAAFEDLYGHYQRRLRGYLLRTLGDEARSEELANDVLVAVWKGAHGFRGRSRVSTWIFGIAHHKAMSELRSRRPPAAEIEAASAVADPRPGPEEDAARAERRTRLRQALAGLSPEHREVLELTFLQGLAYGEIARIVGCPLNTVKTRMFYARKKLEAILSGMGLTAES